MNPIMSLLNSQANPQQNSIFNVINTIKNAQNPTMMLQSMMANNPQLQQVMDYVKSQGGNAEQAFYNLAQQQGVDPKSILDQLK